MVYLCIVRNLCWKGFVKYENIWFITCLIILFLHNMLGYVELCVYMYSWGFSPSCLCDVFVLVTIESQCSRVDFENPLHGKYVFVVYLKLLNRRIWI